MTKLELMTVLRSLKKLHQAGKPELAEEVIDEMIAEAENDGRRRSSKEHSSPETD